MIIVLAMMLILAVACGGVTDVESVQLRAVGLKNDVLTLYKGAEVKVSATIKPDSANAEIQWKTADVTIATVSSDGVVKGVSVGQTKLTVHVGQVERTIDIVVDDYVPIESISFAKSEMTIDTGVRKQLDFTVLPQNATVKTLSFTVEPTDEENYRQLSRPRRFRKKTFLLLWEWENCFQHGKINGSVLQRRTHCSARLMRMTECMV